MPDRQGVSSPQPFKDRTTSEFLVTTIGGCFLAFNAGYLNGTTMEDNGVSTTHVSGTATRFGRYMADEDKYNITLNGGIMLSFLIGSFITGCIVSHQTFYFGHTYGKVMLLAGVMLVAVYAAEVVYPDRYWYDYVAAVAAGIQNAMWSRYTGNIMRTTHVTGTTTDIGLFLGRRLVGNSDYMWKVQVLVCMYLSFFFGSFVAGKTFSTLGKRQSWVNILFFTAVGGCYTIYMMYYSYAQLSFWEMFCVSEDQLCTVVKRREHSSDTTDAAASSAAVDDTESLHDTTQLHLRKSSVVSHERDQGERQPSRSSLHRESSRGSRWSVTSYIVVEKSVSRSASTTSPEAQSLALITSVPTLDKWDTHSFNLVLVSVVLLAFNAGLINGTCQSAPNGTSVTHMTSTTSNAALNLAASRYDDFYVNVGNIGSFLGGAMTAGTLVSEDVLRLNVQYVKIWVLGLIALSGAAFVLMRDDSSNVSGYLCSLAAGLQNAMASKFSGCVIRTTHVSGSTSDLGSTLAKVFIRGQYKDLWKVKLLLCAVSAFVLGGYVAGKLYPTFEERQLFLCVGVYFTVGVSVMLTNRHIVSSRDKEKTLSLLENAHEYREGYTPPVLSNGSLKGVQHSRQENGISSTPTQEEVRRSTVGNL